MKRLLFLYIILICFSCNKKTVQLPETTNQDITEVLDVSPVYMFYDEENDSIEFNRKNMISTTNWLVNIDKRLTLKQILPHLQYLQDKRHGDGMHKNKNARNYFTCNNIDLKNLSFIDFTDVVFETDLVNELLPDFNEAPLTGLVEISSLEKIEMMSMLYEHGETLYFNLNELLNYINESIQSHKTILKISFNSNLSFQDYIEVKSKMFAIKSDSLKIFNHELIYY